MNTRSLTAALLALALVSAVSGCKTVPDEPGSKPASNASAKAPLTVGKVRMVHPPEGSAVEAVRSVMASPENKGRQTIVYVGATWCEPCQHFHKAVTNGELDAAFPTLTIVEFDADRDNARVREAGYISEYIPLFVRPDTEGRATARRFSGSVKGEAAVANITPRLRSLLDP